MKITYIENVEFFIDQAKNIVQKVENNIYENQTYTWCILKIAEMLQKENHFLLKDK